MATEINDEFLLQCVSNYKPLYDKTAPGYKSLLQKENCWHAVARSLNVDVTVVKTRFKALREKYRRVLTIEEKLRRSGAAACPRTPWALMSFCTFMYREETPRATCSNYNPEKSTESLMETINQDLLDHDYIVGGVVEELDTPQNENSEDISNASVHFDELPPMDKPSRGHSSTHTPRQNKKGRDTDSVSSVSSEVDIVLKDVSAAVQQISNRPINKYDQFGKYLSCELQEMDKKDADILMEKITLELINYKRTLRNN